MKVLKVVLFLLVVLAVGIAITAFLFQQSIQPKVDLQTKNIQTFTVSRLVPTPIVHPTMHSRLEKEAEEYGYTNINGPSLIRVPDWIEQPLGRYYLYFAHHKGQYLRLAYADSLQGPWTMYDGEIMPLEKSGTSTVAAPAIGISTLKKYVSWSELVALSKIGGDAKKAWEARNAQKMKSSPPTTPHVASPEVIIDEVAKEIRLYYHGVVEGNLQLAKVALSKDGLQFEPVSGYIGAPYLRVFSKENYTYALGMPGFLYRSTNGLDNFEVRKRWLCGTDVRHSGLLQEENMVYIFYSRVGDKPERILYSQMDISSDDWNDWKMGPSKELLRPELEWEGANLEKVPSMRGEMGVRVNQLRDPDIFKDADEQLYLLYTGAGEQAIGIATLNKE